MNHHILLSSVPTAKTRLRPPSQLTICQKRRLASANGMTAASCIHVERDKRDSTAVQNVPIWRTSASYERRRKRLNRKGANMPRGKTKDRDGVFTRKDRPGDFYGSWIDASGRRRKRKLAAHTLQQARTLVAAEKRRVDEQRTKGYAAP